MPGLYKIFTCVVLSLAAASGQNVLTGGYDLGRTNANLNETILSSETVRRSLFGKLFTLPVDGQIYAQPLYEQNVSIPGQATHNVVFVATEHNSVYAYDADIPGSPLWTVNLGPAVPSSVYNPPNGTYTDIAPEIGIVGTPVIDPSTGTLYVVAATMENGSFYQRLHALDVTSGAERFGAPVVIAAQVSAGSVLENGGVLNFDPQQHLQRPALLLWNGVVYVAFGSHADVNPWHGWMIGYSASNVQLQTAVFNATSNGWGGAIWQSGRGPAVDGQGNIYVVTSNGDSDDITDFSDAVLRLDSAHLAIQDWFAPSDQQTIDDDDDDLGSAGALLIPGTNLLVTGGKEGSLYLLNSGSLGQLNGGPEILPISTYGVFNMALWNREGGPVLYTTAAAAPFSAYRLTGNQFGTVPASQTSSVFGIPYEGMTISANGAAAGTGILWATTPDSWPPPSTVTLHAYYADDLSLELWNSNMNAADAVGGFIRFVNPTVVNGKVYVPTASHQLVVYGMLPSSSTPVVTALVNAASYANGPIAPGEMVAVYGQNLGPQELVTGGFDENGNLSRQLDGVEVAFNGVAAPLIYASSGAIAAIVPFEIAGSATATVEVSYYGKPSAVQTYNVAPCAPGIFTADSSGSGEGAILNEDASLNSAANPALPGSVIAVYATGGGLANSTDATGGIVQAANPLAASTTATIGGQPATVVYAGDAPDEVAGMVQVNIQVPAGVSGAVPVVVTAGGVSSQPTATVVIEGAGKPNSSFSRRVPRVP